MAIDSEAYRAFFQRLTRRTPYEYQMQVAAEMCAGRNVVLRAPTGAGKTWAVLAPFLFDGWEQRPRRLIYALPLRTLAQGVYREATDAAARLGHRLDAIKDEQGREIEGPFVTLQTGERPDDRFFDRGRVVVTTYDQVLSGLLCGPYGLSERLHNVNAASIVGALVVFDEFHLMEPALAFMTAAAGLHLFRELCQSVWMTATATQPLDALLADALAAVAIPGTEAETEALLRSLPSVTTVRREIVLEPRALSADGVIDAHRRRASVVERERGASARSIVLLNTVGRAQAMFEDLRVRLAVSGRSLPLVLLHSRFFSEDRRAKESQIRKLFGRRGATGPAILVATQVVEAGLDISCDDLHTELCPMNALIQRAGRCARFEGETGTVHVHPLPPEERAWLPYGDLHHEDATLARTRTLLERTGGGPLHPGRATTWVREVHEGDDEKDLREGWRSRLTECLRRIEQKAILHGPRRVADLIRGEDTDAVRVIVADEARRPQVPGRRESLSLSRRSLYRLFRNGEQHVGWIWDGSDEEPWQPLRVPADLSRTYAVCLHPSMAAYDDQAGLRLGVAGGRQSSDREEAPRPGYAPYRAEAWVDHARRVAEHAERRLQQDQWRTGLLSVGFRRRYGLAPEALLQAVRACGLLHDLGKLQEPWQRWAAAAQSARSSEYRHVLPLAHTDFDPENEEDRQRERNLGVRRPAHAPASAYYGAGLLAELLSSVPVHELEEVASACAAAVLAHHGGWLPSSPNSRQDLGIAKLHESWEAAVGTILSLRPDGEVFARLQMLPDKRSAMELLLRATSAPEGLVKWWPLVAYLTRTLRLSDQRATAEIGCNE